MEKMIMDILVQVHEDAISQLTGPTGKVAMLPFDAEVRSELFTGRTLPGGVDVQTTNAAGIRSMCAKYMFEGHDCAGNPCRIFVRNEGWFEPGSEPDIFRTCPTFLTDSPVLSGYLHTARFRAEGGVFDGQLHIRVFDIAAE